MRQPRQESHAFPFVRIGLRDDGACGCCAGGERRMRHVGGEVDQGRRPYIRPVLQRIAADDGGDAFEHEERGFVGGVFVRAGAAAGGRQSSSALSAGFGGGAKVRTGTEKRSSSRSSGVGAKARVPGIAAVFLSEGCAEHAGTVQRFYDGARGRAGEKVE